MRERLSQWFESQGLKQAKEAQVRIARLGGQSKILGNGRDGSVLNEVASHLKGNHLQVIFDFDGVLVSPSHFVLGAGDKTVGFERLRSLFRIAETVERTIIWTSRFNISLGKSYFPFWTEETTARFSKHGIEIRANKSLQNPEDQLLGMIEETRGITHYVGSSQKDRKMIEKLLKKRPELASKFIFLDTGHCIL